MPDRRPRHASSETDTPLLETDMPHRRLTMTCLRSLIGISTHLNIFIFIYFLLIYINIGIIYWGKSVSDVNPMKHVEVFNQASRSPMGLQ